MNSHEAVKDYYKKRFDVEISTDEIVAVPGSQEGVAHLGLTLCNPGDVVLLPNPGYPVFGRGLSRRRRAVFLRAREENDFLPKFDEIPEDIARRAKYIMVSYPYNPVCAVAPASFYEELIAYAKNTTSSSSTTMPTRISSMTASGRLFPGISRGEGGRHRVLLPVQILQSDRCESVLYDRKPGNHRRGQTVRSQYDFGIFEPIQRAAIAALRGP